MNNTEPDIIDPENKAFEALAKMLVIMRLSGFVMATYAILIGTLIVMGGPARFTAVGYVTAMLVPGAPASWGIAMLIFGCFAFYGLKTRKYRLGMVSMFMAGVWSFAFGGAFLVSAVQYPEANITAMVTYGKDGVLFVLMAVVHALLSKVPLTTEVLDA